MTSLGRGGGRQKLVPLRYHLRTLLIVLAVGPMVLWIGFVGLSDKMPIHTVSTAAEFNELIASERAIIHLDVDWAMQAVRSRPFVERLKQEMSADRQFVSVLLQRIDCSRQDGEVWHAAKTWCERHPKGRAAIYGGYGALVWIENGQPKDIVINAAETGHVDLLARTRNAFGKE